MRITTDAKSLKQALATVKKIAPSRSLLPFLEDTAMIVALNGSVIIKATDGEVAGGMILPASIKERGEGMISISRALLFAKGECAGSSSIDIYTEITTEYDSGEGMISNGVTSAYSYPRSLTCQLTNCTLEDMTSFSQSLLDLSDTFPLSTIYRLPSLKSSSRTLERELGVILRKLPADIARYASYVLPYAAKEKYRPALTGVVFQFEKDKLTLVAADGYRLAETEIDYIGNEYTSEFIVPAKTIRLLARMKGEIWFGYDGIGCVAFYAGVDATKIVSKTVQGTFPRHKRLIPPLHKDHHLKWKVSCSGKTVMERLSLIPKTRLNDVILTVARNGESLSLSSKPDTGDGPETTMSVPATTDGEGRVSLNKTYLSLAASALGDMTIEVYGEFTAVLLYGSTANLTCLIMPIKGRV